MSVNKVILVGRLGKKPELRYTQAGKANASWRMATGNAYRNRDGELIEHTEWHNVKVFGPQAENCEKYLDKGRQVYVEGRIETREYEKDGHRKYWTEVIAHTVRFLGGRGSGRDDETVAEVPEFGDQDIPF